MELEDLRKLESLLNEYNAAYPGSDLVHSAWLEVMDKLDDIDPEFH